ncbi:MAG TPA: response regulator [Verrucomicrobiae bacterium]|nr:response regulator [Verrucomicrobiae bacterium]
MSNHTEVEVLLVEDNARDAEMALRTLRKRNLANSIVHVKDGQEAIDWLFGEGAYANRDCSKPPKVVLLDLKLPKLDGLEVLRAIRGNERTRLIPVVLMTSSGEERDVIESYKLGVNSYVIKPMDFEGFSAAVAELGHYWLLVNQDAK